MALGILANALSVGANTVNGPGPLSVSTRPAASTAASKVLKVPADCAESTTSAALAAPNGKVSAATS